MIWRLVFLLLPILRALAEDTGEKSVEVELPGGKFDLLQWIDDVDDLEYAIQEFLRRNDAYTADYAATLRDEIYRSRVVPFARMNISTEEGSGYMLKVFSGDNLDAKAYEASLSMGLGYFWPVFTQLVRHLDDFGVLHLAGPGSRYVPPDVPPSDAAPPRNAPLFRDPACPLPNRPPRFDSSVIDALPLDKKPFRVELRAAIYDAFDPASMERRRRPLMAAVDGGIYNIHPLSFSLPASVVAPAVPTKEAAIAHVIPGNMDTYAFSEVTLDSEYFYLANYSRSLFGITFRKAGWDCLRHLEILAAGAIPLFPEVDRIPPHTMAAYPKRLLELLGSRFPGTVLPPPDVNSNYSTPGQFKVDAAAVDFEAYFAATNALLQYTRSHLTTEAMALRVLQVMDVCPQKVLFVSPDIDQAGDYLTDGVLHGLKTLLGASNVVDFARRDAIYNTPLDMDPAGHLAARRRARGLGYAFCCRLDEFPGSTDRSRLEERVRAREFDLIVIAMIDRSFLPASLTAEICRVYGAGRGKVAVLHGGDKPITAAEVWQYSQCGVLFAREIEEEEFVAKAVYRDDRDDLDGSDRAAGLGTGGWGGDRDAGGSGSSAPRDDPRARRGSEL